MSSELLAGAAEALSAPEVLVERSAQARARADGIPVEDVLRAWAGGTAAVAAPAAPPEVEAAPAVTAAPTVDTAPPETAAPTLEPAETAAPVPEPAPAPAVLVQETPGAAPILVGRRESLLKLVAGTLGLFALAALFAFLVPALDATPGTFPEVEYTIDGLQGREIYVAEGCFYCHTQQVRPIVADAGIGPVTRSDRLAPIAPDTLGLQRIGPDLAHAGSRPPTNDFDWITEYLVDPRRVNARSLHPSYGHLSEEEIHDLAHFVWESR